jgi:hypothetical protein
MPTVAVTTERSVGVQALGGVKQPNLANGTSAFGNQIAATGNRMAIAKEKEAAKTDKLMIDEADNNLQQTLLDIEDGYANLKGKEGFEGQKDYQARITKAIGDSTNQLTPRQKVMQKNRGEARGRHSASFGLKHARQEKQSWDDNLLKSKLVTNKQAAINDPSKPNVMGRMVEQMEMVKNKVLENMGGFQHDENGDIVKGEDGIPIMDPETLEVAEQSGREAASDLVSETAHSLLRQGRIGEADAVIDLLTSIPKSLGLGTWLTPDDKKSWDDARKEVGNMHKVSAIIDEHFDKTLKTTTADQVNAAQAAYKGNDPKVRAEIDRRMKNQINMARKAKLEVAYNTVDDWRSQMGPKNGAAAKSLTTLKMENPNYEDLMDPADIVALEEHERRLATEPFPIMPYGMVEEVLSWQYDDVKLQSMDSPVIANVFLTELQYQDFEYNWYRANGLTPPRMKVEDLELIRADDKRLKDAYKAMGLDPANAPRTNGLPSDSKRITTFHRFINKKIIDFRAEKGQIPNSIETQELIDEYTEEFVTREAEDNFDSLTLLGGNEDVDETRHFMFEILTDPRVVNITKDAREEFIKSQVKKAKNLPENAGLSTEEITQRVKALENTASFNLEIMRQLRIKLDKKAAEDAK